VKERLATGPAPFTDEFATATATAAPRTGRVDVIHGIYAHSLPLAGMTVGQARAELTERMNIAPQAVAVVDGREAGEEELLREGQVLNFVSHPARRAERKKMNHRDTETQRSKHEKREPGFKKSPVCPLC